MNLRRWRKLEREPDGDAGTSIDNGSEKGETGGSVVPGRRRQRERGSVSCLPINAAQQCQTVLPRDRINERLYILSRRITELPTFKSWRLIRFASAKSNGTAPSTSIYLRGAPFEPPHRYFLLCGHGLCCCCYPPVCSILHILHRKYGYQHLPDEEQPFLICK